VAAYSAAGVTIPTPTTTASFTYSPLSPVTGQAVSFDGSASICVAAPCSYRWTDDADNSLLGTGHTMTFTFRDVGTKYVRLSVTDALAHTVSVEHDLVVGSPPTSTPTPAALTWTPPTCGVAPYACRDLYLTNTGSNQRPLLSSLVDYRIHLPSTGPLEGGLQIRGGHNVIIIGGEIDLTTPCSDSSSDCHGINISRGSAFGEVYIEGVLITNPDPDYLTDTLTTGDGIDVDNYPGVTDVVLQNVRIEGIKGCSPEVPSAHADVFQPYNAGGAALKVDHLTGTTDCQGMQVEPDYSYANYGGLMPRSGRFKNVNIRVFPNPSRGDSNRYAWWFTYGVTSCVSYPITLENVYTQERDGSLARNAVWPDTDNAYGCPAVYSDGVASWPNLPTLTGSINNGPPPDGPFVPAGVAGVGYVSPGYE
jgi:hypothetical protein